MRAGAPVDSTSTFGSMLRRLRIAATLTQEELAERAGISANAVAALERGRRTFPRPDTVERLAGALQLPPTERRQFVAMASEGRDGVAEVRPRTPRSSYARLHVPPNSVVGREHDEAAIAHLFTVGSRLVTLTGPGGVGKTRLAVRVGTTLEASYRDGCSAVDLSTVHDPQMVAAVILQTLNLQQPGARPHLEVLVEKLGDRRLLLILDNFEQVIEAASLIAHVLDECPHLDVLVTSRAPLQLRVEQQYPVAPLDTPPAQVTEPREIALFSAVELFVTRARAVEPDFDLTPESALVVAEICRRLDGLPLAIELAAARMSILSPVGLLRRLERGVGALPEGPRDLPARQRTLKATIDWSYSLLDRNEQQMMRRLSVFDGGFTLAAASAVCVSDGDPGNEPDFQTLDTVQSLVQKSLLRAAAGSESEPRFAMLETIREFALDLLIAGGEHALIRKRHALWFAALAESAEPHLRSGDREIWLQRLHLDSDNLRSALAWCREMSPALGLQIAAALPWFWRCYEWFAEGRIWLTSLLDHPANAHPGDTRARALYGAGMLAWYDGDVEEAGRLTESSLSGFLELDQVQWIATSQRLLGLIRTAQGDLETARALLAESRERFRAIGDSWGEAMTLYRLGLAVTAADNVAARGYFRESLVLFEQNGDALGTAVVLNALAVDAAARGDDGTALDLITRSLPFARQATDRWDLARLLINAGSLWLHSGDEARARDLFTEGLLLWREIGHPGGIALGLAGLASVATGRGDAQRAGLLLGVASTIIPPSDTFVSASTVEDIEDRVASARRLLDGALFQSGWEAAGELSLDDVVREAVRG